MIGLIERGTEWLFLASAIAVGCGFAILLGVALLKLAGFQP